MPFDTASDVKLTDFRAVMAQTTPANPVFSAFDYRINVWSSKAAFIANAQLGDVASYMFTDPTTGPTLWGTKGVQPLVGVKPTYLLTFDLTPLNIIVPAGTDRRIGIQQMWGTTQNGDLGLMESTENGVTDCRRYASSPAGICFDLDPNSLSIYYGRMAVDLRGIPQ